MRRRIGNRLGPLPTGVFLAWVFVLASALLSGPCVPAGEDRPAAGGLAGRVIVLDPGHGGRHPGANRDGVLEKDIVLDIGLITRDLLRAAGAVVLMTRETDVDYSEPVPGRKKRTDLEARRQMV